MSLTLYCLNGPNLNLLGQREPHIYGTATLGDVEALCREAAGELGAALVFRQTNREGELVDWIQEAREKADALVLNAAAYTHTSVALHDALKALTIPAVEVHLSNPAAREDFRRVNYVAPAASGSVAGFGAFGYRLALQAAAHLAQTRRNQRHG
jgi:3-dehydroquinate dehydratase II